MTKQKLVEVKNLCMNYHTTEGETKALENISFDVYEGEFLSILGPSGCGKSTILSLISGLLPPSGGEILINGKIVEGPNESVAYMFQHDHLFEWRNIEQNVLLGLEIKRDCTHEKKAYAISLLKNYGLGNFLRHYPSQLSGGMRQKVALFRTLAVDPEILLLDEPFSALDYQTRLSVSMEVSDIIRKEEKTAVLVTHDISEAIALSDRVIILSDRPSVVAQELYIEFSKEHLTPLEKRQEKEFQTYFNTIWKELHNHVNT